MSAKTASPTAPACSACKTPIPVGSRFCTTCGTAIPAIRADWMGLEDRKSEPLLAEANLLRLRGLFDAAEAKCIEVLRSDPNNVHAHSLLGDLYKDQKRMEEAAQWYRLALDLDPNSRADKVKLERALEEMAKRAMRDAPRTQGSTGSIGGTQKLMGVSPVNWLRGITAVSVVFVVLVAGIVLSTRGGNNTPDVRGTIPGTGKPASGLPDGSAPMMGSPLPIQSAPAAVTPPSTGPVRQAPKPSPIPSVRVIPPSTGATEAEIAIQSAIAMGGLGSDVLVGPVTIDPREGTAHIVLILSGLLSSDAARSRAMQAALRAAQAAFARNGSLQRASMSIRAGSRAGGTDPIFGGDIDRHSAESADPTAGADDSARLFSDPWWAPAYAPPVNSDSSSSEPRL